MIEFDNILVTDIVRSMTVHAAKGKAHKKVNRESYGLALCISGQITYTMDGVDYLSTPGSAVLLPKGSTYFLNTDKPGLFPLINFQCEGLPTDTIAVLPLSDPRGCIALYEKISRLSPSGGSRLDIYSAFYELLSKLQPQKEQRLFPALGCIEDHLSDPSLSNSTLARSLGISEVYLRKLFLNHYNTTPKQFILDKRIARAKQLLLDTSLTVTEIGESCGFSSVYHFCRAFKEKVGITPTQYAKRNRIYRL